MGFVAAVFQQNSFACVTVAFSTGAPAGPISAFLLIKNVGMVLFEAIRVLEIPNYLQLIGLVLGILGGLILTIPNHLIRIIKC